MQVVTVASVQVTLFLLFANRVETDDGAEVHASLFARLHTVHVHATHGSYEWRRKSPQPVNLCH